MWDAGARGRRRGARRLLVWTSMFGVFTWTKKKASSRPSPEPLPSGRIVIEGLAMPRAPPTPRVRTAPREPLREELRFQGLHEDVNPSRSVRPAEMTCPSCDRHFRYFLNAGGSKTPVACPGCGRQYRF